MRDKTIPDNRIVCLVGSTKFKREFDEAALRLGLKGCIVLSVICYNHGDFVGLSPEEKAGADELHFRKIDLADEVYVINPGRYIGTSSAGEIDYAVSKGKTVTYLEGSDAGIETPAAPACGDDRRTVFDAVTSFLKEVKNELVCRCGRIYTDRRMHAPDCRHYLSEEASKLIVRLTDE